MAGVDHMLTIGSNGYLYIYHPDDLQHRKASPPDWHAHDFAISKDLVAGRLIAVNARQHCGYKVRVTTGSLTAREQKWRKLSWDFRLHVEHGKVFLDGGDFLPSVDQRHDPRDYPQYWVDIDNGDYQVIVHSIRWTEEPGALDEQEHVTPNTLPEFVFQFKRARSLDDVPPTETPPMLSPHEQETEYRRAQAPRPRWPGSKPPPDLDATYPLLVWPADEPFNPWRGLAYPVRTPAAREHFFDEKYLKEGVEDERYVLAPKDSNLAVVGSPSGSSAGPKHDPVVYFSVLALVQIDAIKKQAGRLLGRFSLLKRKRTTVSSSQTQALKEAFMAAVPAVSAQRIKLYNASFEIERVSAMNDGADVAAHLMGLLPLSWVEQCELIEMNDAERAARLIKLLRNSLQAPDSRA